MKDIIDYYEDGGPSTGTAEQKKAHKDWAEDWMKKLKTEFYDNANPLGRQGMYLVLSHHIPAACRCIGRHARVKEVLIPAGFV